MAFDRKKLEQSVSDLEQSVLNLKRLQQIADSAQLSEKQIRALCEMLGKQSDGIRLSAEMTAETIRQSSESNTAILKKTKDTLQRTNGAVEKSSELLGKQIEQLGTVSAEGQQVILTRLSEDEATLEEKLQGMQGAMDKAATDICSLVTSGITEIETKTADGFAEIKKQQMELRLSAEKLSSDAANIRTELEILKGMVKDNSTKTLAAVIFACVAAVAAIIGIFL